VLSRYMRQAGTLPRPLTEPASRRSPSSCGGSTHVDCLISSYQAMHVSPAPGCALSAAARADSHPNHPRDGKTICACPFGRLPVVADFVSIQGGRHLWGRNSIASAAIWVMLYGASRVMTCTREVLKDLGRSGTSLL